MQSRWTAHGFPVRPIDGIVGPAGARKWTDEEKAQIVSESLQPGAV
nr:hypothetical protein [uncultured Cohaesibacter sp.]